MKRVIAHKNFFVDIEAVHWGGLLRVDPRTKKEKSLHEAQKITPDKKGWPLRIQLLLEDKAHGLRSMMMKDETDAKTLALYKDLMISLTTGACELPTEDVIMEGVDNDTW